MNIFKIQTPNIKKQLLFFILILIPSCKIPNKTPFFQKVHQPYHISVSAVLFNNEGKLIILHNENEKYKLMAESVENNESILTTLERGLKEELGATAKPIAFLGTTTQDINENNYIWEKTTIYICCKLTSLNPNNRDKNDYEINGKIITIDPNELINIFSNYKSIYKFNHDESEIIRRGLPYIEKNLNKDRRVS